MGHFMTQLLCAPHCCLEAKAFLFHMLPKKLFSAFQTLIQSLLCLLNSLCHLGVWVWFLIYWLGVYIQLLFLNQNVLGPLIYCDQMASIVRMQTFDHLSQSMCFLFVVCIGTASRAPHILGREVSPNPYETRSAWGKWHMCGRKFDHNPKDSLMLLTAL